MEALKLHGQGWTQREIADKIGVSQSRVHQMLKAIRMRLHDEQRREMALIRMSELQRFNHIYREAMSAWERSKGKDGKRRKTRIEQDLVKTMTSDTLSETHVPVNSKRVLEEIETDGNPRFLTVAMRALDAEARLLGTYAPVKVSQSRELKPEEDLSELDLMKQAAAELNAMIASAGVAKLEP
jgi:transcriptional regulator with XRE-family HTH domain